MSCASCGLKPPKPRVCELITRSPANDFFTWLSIEDLIDAAKTVNNATTATPIIKAAAAPLVRRGFRCAFSLRHLAGDTSNACERRADQAAHRSSYCRTEDDEGHDHQQCADTDSRQPV